jgi:hypothetical protein
MVRLLVHLGADINQKIDTGVTPLIVAAGLGKKEIVRCLLELGASIGLTDDDGDTALHMSAQGGNFLTIRYLVEYANQYIAGGNAIDERFWDQLLGHLTTTRGAERFRDSYDCEALAALMRALVLRSAPPPEVVALLSPEPARVVQEGARLLAQLPAYLVRTRALLDVHCLVLLPPLRALVHGYMEPNTTEELWVTGSGDTLLFRNALGDDWYW